MKAENQNSRNRNFFSFWRNLKDSDDDVKHLELLGFWTLSIVRNSKCKKTQENSSTDMAATYQGGRMENPSNNFDLNSITPYLIQI
jgi:hypothetical protein